MDFGFPTAIEKILYSTSDDIKHLSKSFLQQHKLTYFFFMRVYKDNTCVLLSTHPDLCNHVLRQKTEVLPPYPKKFIGHKFYYLIPHNADLEIMRIVSERFNLYNPFSIIYPSDNFYEIFCFGVNHPNLEQISYYFNHVAEFEFFATECKKELAKYFIKNKFLIELPAYMYNDNSHLFSSNLKQKNAPQQVKFNINGFPISFTRREFDCLQYLIQGNSAKETAKQLLISPRTVENYLENIKQKTFSRTKIELFSKISQAGDIK